MLEKERREAIIRLMNEQVVPAVGCTEPMAVALCVARATELLGQRPEKINVLLSGNMLKNAMGVGIPGTGMIGLPIAIALGAIVGKSEYNLEVIKDLTPETLAEGKEYIKGDHITIGLKNQCCDKLYIEVEVTAGDHRAQAIIMHTHTNFTHEERDGEVLLDKTVAAAGEQGQKQRRTEQQICKPPQKQRGRKAKMQHIGQKYCRRTDDIQKRVLVGLQFIIFLMAAKGLVCGGE